MLRKLVHLLLIAQCFLLVVSHAQPGISTSFIHIDTRQGLSQSHVSRIIKDHKGFMWFATDAGLNRYDGYRFRVFKHQNKNPSSISNNLIKDIVQEDERYLWVGTGSGLDRFDYQKETFTHFNPGKETLVCSILKDSKKRMWVGTIDGFFQVNPVTGKFTPIPLQSKYNSTFNSWLIHDMVEDGQGRFWLATNRGLVVFNPATGASSAYDGAAASTAVKELLSNWVRAIYVDLQGKIWIGSIGRGIACFDPQTQQFSLFQHKDGVANGLVHNDILSFEEDASGQLWIGTENGGISIRNPQSGQFQTIASDPFDPHSLSNNSVYTIHRDDLGNMWVGTWSGGVNLLPAVGEKMAYVPYVAGKPDGLNNSSILSINSTDDRTIWVGTDGGGLNALDLSTMKFTHFLAQPGNPESIKDNYVISVQPIDSNLLGLGYQREGLDLFNTKTRKVVRHISIKQQPGDVIDFSVNSMCRDRHNNLWVGTWGAGLMVFDGHYQKIAQYLHSPDSNSMINDFVNCIIEDHNGIIWFGTEEGLGAYDPVKRTFQSYQHRKEDQKTICHNQVNDVLEDAKGNIWLVSTGGLNKIDPSRKNIRSYQQEVGQLGNSMMSILEDQHGVIWISTYTGLTAFYPTTETFKNFVEGQRLKGQEFKNNSAYRARNGYLFLGGTDGFNFFHPDSLKESKLLPDVRFTGFRLFNQEQQPGMKGSVLEKAISTTDTVILNYQQNVFTIDFAALGYVFPENNQYAYMLESFDKEWIYSGQNRSATYTNLNPGKYVFKVKATNNDGVWNEKVASLLIIVEPPFWKTFGFRVLIFLALIGAILGFVRYRVASYYRQKVLLEEQVKQQTKELVLANLEESKAREEAEKAKGEADELNLKLQLTNQEMEHLVYIVSHDLKEPLRTTTSFIELLEKKYKELLDGKGLQYLHFITDASNRMKNMIDDLLDYSRIGKTNQPIWVDVNELLQNVLSDLKATIQEQGAVVSYDPMPSFYGYATELKLLFQNLISNAIKFRKKGVAPTISIKAEDQQTHWLFSFQDNGIGIESEYHEKVFQLFQRLHLRTEYEGTGIGLAHCQRIVALHEGKIWVDSTLGEGSTFHFTISKNLHQGSVGSAKQ